MAESSQTEADAFGSRGSICGATPVTTPCAYPAGQPGSFDFGSESFSAATVSPWSRAYSRPTVCMRPWQFGRRKPVGSLRASAVISSTAASGSSADSTISFSAAA